MDPKGRVALVTGGASGIGLGCSKQLLESGANVVLCDVNGKLGKEKAQELATQYGEDRVMFIKTDVTKESEFEDAFKKTLKQFKTLDIVFNNAGVFDDAHWELEVDINLKGVIRGTMLAIKYMGKNNGGNGGVVVNTASIFGLQSSEFIPMYAATKHGVVGFSQSMGLPYHFDQTGVRVLTLCPGATSTPMHNGGHKNSFLEKWGQDFGKVLDIYPVMMPENVGQSVLHMIQVGQSGSVWVSEGDETYSVNIPDRKLLRNDL